MLHPVRPVRLPPLSRPALRASLSQQATTRVLITRSRGIINEGTTKGRSLADEFGGSRRLVGLVAALVILGLFLMGLVDGQVDAKAEIERGLERASKAVEGTKKRVEPEGSLGVVNERGYTMSPAAESWGGGFSPKSSPMPRRRCRSTLPPTRRWQAPPPPSPGGTLVSFASMLQTATSVTSGRAPSKPAAPSKP